MSLPSSNADYKNRKSPYADNYKTPAQCLATTSSDTDKSG